MGKDEKTFITLDDFVITSSSALFSSESFSEMSDCL